jgi:hypothetical protein
VGGFAEFLKVSGKKEPMRALWITILKALSTIEDFSCSRCQPPRDHESTETISFWGSEGPALSSEEDTVDFMAQKLRRSDLWRNICQIIKVDCGFCSGNGAIWELCQDRAFGFVRISMLLKEMLDSCRFVQLAERLPFRLTRLSASAF